MIKHIKKFIERITNRFAEKGCYNCEYRLRWKAENPCGLCILTKNQACWRLEIKHEGEPT